MDIARGKYSSEGNIIVISAPEQIHAGKGPNAKESRHLDQARPNFVLLQLALEDQNAAVVIIRIESFSLSRWPGCTFFGAAVVEILHSGDYADPRPNICESIDRIVRTYYPQVDVDVSKALSNAQVRQLPFHW